MTTFYTADHHFNHEAVIRMCARPFSDVEEMNETMIHRWNSVVGPKDDVHVVGDFAMKGSAEEIGRILKRLRGRKHLVIGNHDPLKTRGQAAWHSVPEHRRILKDDGVRVVLDHYGMRVWPGMWHGAIHLYGHSHGKLPGNGNSTDVGVDCWDFFPVTLDQIRERLKTQTFVQPEEGHGLEAFDESDHS